MNCSSSCIETTPSRTPVLLPPVRTTGDLLLRRRGRSQVARHSSKQRGVGGVEQGWMRSLNGG